ncbi:MAG: hypothetical protein KBC22_00545 [Candidatus Pacebacteria bacterium]|nr:hypothetical protein [Candidatus Paceibacterota bacterium]
MRNKFKAFIGIAIISLSLFTAPVGVFLSTVDVTGSTENAVTVNVETTVAFAQESLTESESECSLVMPSNVMGCVADLVRIIFEIFWWFTSIAGQFLDFFIDYSISSQTYAQGSDFVHRGWALVRDIANIFFIFVLLYIAIGTILNLKQVDTKKMLTKVIIIALLINFSLFFTKIVIDASNILARAFIGSMEINVTDEDGNPIESNATQFSVAIVAKFNPNKLLDDKEGSPYHQFKQENPNTASTLRLVMLLAGIAILVVMIWTFFKVAFLFLARVITLWLTMITAPIAFISIVLPFNIPKLGHQEWTKNLFSAAFMAPIFLFFMYLVIVFLDMGFFDNVALNSSQGFGDMLLRILIPFVIIMMLVLAAAKVAEQMSGEIGSVVAKVGGAALGAAAAVATGGAAMGMRMGAGAIGSKMASSTASGRLGRMTRSMGSTLESGSMDWRNTKGGQAIMKNMGMDNFGAGSLGSKAGEGGQKGVKERYQKSRVEDAKLRADNETAADKSTLDGLKTELTQFEAQFGADIRSFEDAITKARQDALDDPTPGNKARLATAKASYDAWKSSVPPGATASYSATKGSVKTAEDNLKRKEFSALSKAADDVNNESFFTTGMTAGDRADVANAIRGGARPAPGGGPAPTPTP